MLSAEFRKFIAFVRGGGGGGGVLGGAAALYAAVGLAAHVMVLGPRSEVEARWQDCSSCAYGGRVVAKSSEQADAVAAESVMVQAAVPRVVSS